MRILLIHTYYKLRGGEDVVFEQESNLLQETNEVEVLTFSNSSGLRGAFFFFLSIWNILTSNKVKKKIESFQPDVIHLHNWHYAAGPLIIRAIKNRKIPLVVTLHNYRLICPSATLMYKDKAFFNSLNHNFSWGAVRHKVYRNSYVQTFWMALILWVHRICGTWNLPDKYILLTEASKNLFIKSKLKIENDKFVIKPNFTKKQDYLKNNYSKSNHFLYVGRLSEEKGIKYLLEAFDNSEYRLQIIGAGPLENDVIEAVAQSSNIEYLGALSKAKVLEKMGEASVLLFPSVGNETFGLTVIEAFSVGTPVIASNIDAMQSIITDGYNGTLFEIGNVNLLKEKLSEWTKKSGEEKKIFSENAYNTFLEKYTPEKNKKKLMDIYQQILK